MLDLVADMFPSVGDLERVDRRFLEPGCGSGNFLDEILRRKLDPIRLETIGVAAEYEHWLLRALASIYAIDISLENVEASRRRMLDVLMAHHRSDAHLTLRSAGFVSAASAIVDTNVVQADMLAHAASIQLIEYRPLPAGHFRRTWSSLDDASGDDAQTSFFAPAPRQDGRPIHYSELAASPEPVAAVDTGRTLSPVPH